MDAATDSLSDTDRLLLAREVAADRHLTSLSVVTVECPRCSIRFEEHAVNEAVRAAVGAGWDAALEWVGTRAGEGIAHLDGDDDHDVDTDDRDYTMKQPLESKW